MSKEQVKTEEVVPQEKLSFKDYKQRLKNECDVAELRARIAEAYMRELGASNQYNQLRAMLEANAQVNVTPGSMPEVGEIPVATSEDLVETPED